MTITASDIWIVLTASACAASCAIVGCFLVLRRLSLMGDAISHAILPGLAFAFILSGTINPVYMLIGALIAGLVAAGLSSVATRAARVPDDSALGVVFTSMFALGALAITFAAGKVDLDASCVLFGELATTPLDRVSAFGASVPRAFAWLAAILVIDVAFVAVFYKELKLGSFDPALATAMGFSAGVLHYLLMALVAGTCVASFEAVGSVLVIAMLVTPPATAHLLTDRLRVMLPLSAGIGVLSAVLGYAGALWFNVNIAGAMSVAAGGLFALAVVFAPRHGVVSREARRWGLTMRIVREDILGELYRGAERGATGAGVSLAETRAAHPAWLVGLALGSLRRRGLVTRGPSPALTSEGAGAARNVVRSHRLWESYLATSTGLPLDHLHEPSHRAEHFVTEAMQAEIERAIGASRDPHGSEIPGRAET